MIAALATIYSAIDQSANMDSMLSNMNTKLDGIRTSLNQVNAQLADIINLLNQLPEVIKGIVDNSAIQTSLGEADQIIALMQRRMRPEYINQYIDRLESDVDNLQIKMGGPLRLGGLSASIATAPYFSTWLAGATAVQKARKRINPNWVIDSPWNQPFMKEQHTNFRGLFALIEDTDRIYTNETIPKMPPHQKTLEVKNGALVPTGIMGGIGYTIKCPGLDGGERLAYTDGLSTIDVKATDAQHAEAREAWKKSLSNRKEILAFYDIAPSLYQKKHELLSVFTEPVNVWQKL